MTRAGAKDDELAYYRRHADELAAATLSLETRIAIIGVEVRQRQRGLSLLAELHRTLAPLTSEDAILQAAVDAIIARLEMDRAVVVRTLPGGKASRLTHHSGYRRAERSALDAARFQLPEHAFEQAGIFNVDGTRDGLLGNLEPSLGMPFFVAAPVVVEGGPNTLIVAGRLKEVYALNPRLDEADADTLAAVAGFVGVMIDLFRRMEQLRASRARLVIAQDEERRRLVRDIHDGAQQLILGIRMKLGMTESVLPKDPGAALKLVRTLKSEASDALESIRELSHGIHPPLLTDQGLHAALTAAARISPTPVRLRATTGKRYPPEVEAAVYFCCLEALQNVTKHASASSIELLVLDEPGQIVVTVVDDGVGFKAVGRRRGRGLVNIEDRLSALGGRLVVESARAQGSRLTFKVPLPTASSG